MHRIEVEQGVRAHFRAAQRETRQPLADQRHIADNAGADRDGPVGQLVPGQQVTGEVRTQDQDQHGNTQQPVEFAWRTVGTGQEDADEMQHRDHHQQVG